MWQHRNPKLMAVEAACQFVREVLPGRLVATNSLTGGWQGCRFIGSFRLEDGERFYRLESDATGLWTVEAIIGCE